MGNKYRLVLLEAKKLKECATFSRVSRGLCARGGLH